MDKVRLYGYKTVHLMLRTATDSDLFGDERTCCGHGHATESASRLEAATGPVTCQRCLRWAEKRGFRVEMGWRRRVRVTLAGWLRALAGWVAP
jgi:hypothetical protein